MDFDDLLGITPKTTPAPAQRVQPLTTKPQPKIVGKNCRKCGEYFKQDMFICSNSFYFPDGYIDICNNCLNKHLGDCADLTLADKFCQYADLPFEPDEWINLQRTEKYNTFKAYCESKWARERNGIDWKTVQAKWIEILEKGEEQERIGIFNQEYLLELQAKWGKQYNQEQLIRFEQLYNDIDKTQSIVTAIQKDNARKMCMLSYKIEEALWSDDQKGSDVKSLIASYNDLAKAADFTPKTAKNIGDFESIGELCAFLEKKGNQFEFYDWVPKDDIDKVMQDLQNYTKRVVIGETNIAEELNEKLEMIQQMNRIENEGYEEEDFSYVSIDDELADEYNEEFEVDG